MKNIIVIFLLISGCSNYIIDPRGSKEPKEIVRDEIECDKIIRDNLNFLDRFLMKENMMRQCLKGRGHSILN